MRTITVRAALTGLLLSLLTTIGLVSIAPSAEAYCINDIPAKTAPAVARKGQTCSQLTNRSTPSNLDINVTCIQLDGSVWNKVLQAGNSSTCGRYFNYVWVYPSTQAWCHIVGTNQPDTLFWVAGGHAWNHWESVTCKIKWV